jgi:hypothetical protein
MLAMRRQEIEVWALKVLERLDRGHSDEDQHVEFKRQWAGIKSRQLAGAANTARGEPLLYLIGIDPLTHEVVGADMTEKANLWPGIVKVFDGSIAPDAHDVELEWKGKRVCAIQFDTDRAPYVVREGDRNEVPWRELTRTRSAGRNELLLLLSETTRLPTVEVLSARIVVVTPPAHCRLEVEVYVAPMNRDRVVIPYHDADLRFRCANRPWIELSHFSIFNVVGSSSHVERSNNDVVFSGPGAATWGGHFVFAGDAEGKNIYDSGEDLQIESSVTVVHASSRLRFSTKLSPRTAPTSVSGTLGYWAPPNRASPVTTNQ